VGGGAFPTSYSPLLPSPFLCVYLPTRKSQLRVATNNRWKFLFEVDGSLFWGNLRRFLINHSPPPSLSSRRLSPFFLAPAIFWRPPPIYAVLTRTLLRRLRRPRPFRARVSGRLTVIAVEAIFPPLRVGCRRVGSDLH